MEYLCCSHPEAVFLLCSASVTLDSFGCSVNPQPGGPCLVMGLVLFQGEFPLVTVIPFCCGRVNSMEEREDQKDRLDFVRNQLNILTEDTKEKIKHVTEEVESKVSNGGVKNLPDSTVDCLWGGSFRCPPTLWSTFEMSSTFLFQY